MTRASFFVAATATKHKRLTIKCQKNRCKSQVEVFLNVGFWPIVLKNSVFHADEKLPTLQAH